MDWVFERRVEYLKELLKKYFNYEIKYLGNYPNEEILTKTNFGLGIIELYKIEKMISQIESDKKLKIKKEYNSFKDVKNVKLSDYLETNFQKFFNRRKSFDNLNEFIRIFGGCHYKLVVRYFVSTLFIKDFKVIFQKELNKFLQGVKIPQNIKIKLRCNQEKGCSVYSNVIFIILYDENTTIKKEIKAITYYCDGIERLDELFYNTEPQVIRREIKQFIKDMEN